MSSLFFILGFLDEYNGRWIIEGDDLVEKVHESDASAGAQLRARLTRLAEEHGIAAPRVEAAEPGWTELRGAALADLINGYYRPDFAGGITVVPSGRRAAAAFLPMAAVAGAGEDDKRAFLHGAYARFGAGNRFQFVNARHKAEITGHLLTEMGCPGVTISLTNPGYVPAIFAVTFDHCFRARLDAGTPS